MKQLASVQQLLVSLVTAACLLPLAEAALLTGRRGLDVAQHKNVTYCLLRMRGLMMPSLSGSTWTLEC